MNKNFAIVENNLVSNVIVIDDMDTNSISALGAISIPDNTSVAIGWSFDGVTFLPPVVVLSIEVIRKNKQNEIQHQFEFSANTDISSLGFIFNGGFDAAIKLDAARRLAEAAGQTSVTFYDISNIGHVLTLAEALTVVIAVSSAYQTILARKQAALVALASAVTEAEINLITW